MEEGSAGWVLFKLLAVLLLVLANGFFVTSEFALVSARRSRLLAQAASGSKAARAALRLLEDPKVFISATQFGVTLASLALGWIGQATLANDIFIPLFTHITNGRIARYVSAHAVAVLVAFSLVTFLHIVLGEITPKTLALERTNSVALLVARPLEIFYKVFRPVIFFLNYSSSHFASALGLKSTLADTLAYSEEELRHMVSKGYQSGVLKEHERRVISNIFDFTDKIVREVMIPRTQVAALDASLGYKQAVGEFIKSGYSRMPVYSGQMDNIIGVVHSKDLMSYSLAPERFSLAAVARRPQFVPDTASLDEALRQMQPSRAHLGIVVDEHGGLEGIITLEDLLEEIVGEINDEYDEVADQQFIHEEPDGSVIVAGGMPVREANRDLDLGIPESDDYNTVAGFLLSRSGKVLSEGESVEFGDFRFTVERVERRRVSRVRVARPARVEQTSSAATQD